ncbi:MAG TPA: tail fiber domain-containing protein [Pyrinomonadaceae bacterium]|nr:tail fiber domain-containing protein [Pyrinomonadaceae bacterium]
MRKLNYASTLLGALFALTCLTLNAQTTDDKNRQATASASGAGVRWEVAAPYNTLTMTVSAPDGQVFSKEFRGGTAPEFALADSKGNALPDGVYNYELRLSPSISPETKKALSASRLKGGADDAATERELRKQGKLPTPVVISGSFTVLRGSVVVDDGAPEPGSRRPSAMRQTRPEETRPAPRQARREAYTGGDVSFIPARAVGAEAIRPPVRYASAARSYVFDQVIPDDLIVQGSLCVGFDCVADEAFGFDTIRLKENNTRIKFEDTSAGSFPTNDWQLTANDSASGGASKFSIEDITGAKVPFTITAGAATNSVFVDSTGRVGLRTSTPVLDIHANTSNTPALRLEQNNSGGFTAQTWDMGANEANFFVRDVTGGSRLPFRIRPGAPTSSIDISADGDVGIGTASPDADLEIDAADLTATIMLSGGSGAGANVGQLTFNRIGTGELGRVEVQRSGANDQSFMAFYTKATGSALAERARITELGRVGIGTAAPDALLSVNGTASKTGGGSWSAFSDERLKNIKGRFTSGLDAVMKLQPLYYEYKRDNALGLTSEGTHVGFGAQAVQKVIPEAVVRNEQGYLLVNNDPIIWTMLNAIKEQQKEIEDLKAQVRDLRARKNATAKTRRARK